MGEHRGWWKLIRICDGEKARGVTLIRYADIDAFVREKIEEQAQPGA